MNILNIELTRIEETKLGFDHWGEVVYSVQILKNEYKVKLLLLLDFKVEDKELLDYLVSTWKYRNLVIHSVDMHELEKIKKSNIKLLDKYDIMRERKYIFNLHLTY